MVPFLKLLLPCVLLAAATSEALPIRYSLGMRTQGHYDFEPGNDYFPGLQAGLSLGGWFGHHPQFQIAYLTNRLEEASGRFIVVEDYYLFSGAWHFRPVRRFDPYVKADLGLNRFDTEGLDIPGASTRITAFSVGAGLSPWPARFAFFYDFGYSLNTSSTVMPGVFSLGFRVNFPEPGGPHAP